MNITTYGQPKKLNQVVALQGNKIIHRATDCLKRQIIKEKCRYVVINISGNQFKWNGM